MIVVLFLALGLGLSVLVAELSVGLKDEAAWLLAGFIFFGFCVALLVGSASHMTKHPLLYSQLLYWAIVSLGISLNRLNK